MTATHPAPNTTSSEELALHARNVHFDVSDAPLHWIPNEPIASHFISSFNLVLPIGEEMFVEGFTEALPYVKDAKLREAMLGFIGQEAVHSQAHDRVLPEFLGRHGIDPRPVVRQLEYFSAQLTAVKPKLKPRARYRLLIEQLALIAAVEHMTAVLGDWVLNADLDGLGADSVMTDLFRWHGAEEVEHRSVAHDVATYFGVGYFHRNLMIMPTPFLILYIFLRNTKYIVRQDPSLPNYGMARLFVEWLRASRRGTLPGAKAIFSAWSYLRPSFTPEEVGNTAQAVAYLARSPAVKRAAG